MILTDLLAKSNVVGVRGQWVVHTNGAKNSESTLYVKPEVLTLA